MNVQRLSAFSDQSTGGNPAGVVIADAMPEMEQMQRLAAEVGYSETAFAVAQDDGFRVRYFSPMSEVPFCGHATIALGAALARIHGNGTFKLFLNDANITVDGQADDDKLAAALYSPPTWSRTTTDEELSEVLTLFGLSPDDLDTRLAPAYAHAGANHLLLFLHSRDTLRAMEYSLDLGKVWMDSREIVTVLLGFIETNQSFHTRNAFASGGVLEDPATGAATAALSGYLRDVNWPHQGKIDVVQGEDMGSRSLLRAEFSDEKGSSIRVSGTVRNID